MSKDLRSVSLLDLLPDSIAADAEVRAMALALDPEIQEVSAAIGDAVILPRISELSEELLDAIAWGFRLNELTLWTDATLDGKRTLLAHILIVLKRSGTAWSVRRIFELLSLDGTLTEWWQEEPVGNAFTYKLRVDASSAGITLYTLQQIRELTRRFAPARCQLESISVQATESATIRCYARAEVGVHMTIGWGA